MSNRSSRRATRTALVTSVLVLALLSACGGDGDGRSDGGGEASGGPEVTTSTVDDAVGSTDDTSSDSTEPGEAEPVEVEGVVVATLEEPIMMLPRPGDDRVWIAERPGRIRTARISDDGTVEIDDEPVLDITDETTTDGERGLLGFAFDADGTVLHVSHTDPDGDTRVDSWDLDREGEPSGRRTIFELDQPFFNHNGGHLLLAPDGSLLLGLGDGGGLGDPDRRAQDDDDLHGKLLRLDPDGGEPEVLAKGLRNPWRFDIGDDGTIWIADVGENTWEEIDHVALADLPGSNFGWSLYEGSEEHRIEPGDSTGGLTSPVHTYDHADGRCSITGGIVLHDPSLPHLDGHFLFADLCEGRVFAITDRAGSGDSTEVLDLGVDVPQPFSFGRDGDGRAYVLSASGDVVALRPKR